MRTVPIPKDLLLEEEILYEIHSFVKNNFEKFGHKKINNTYWFNPSWSPFIKYCFFKLGEKKGFTLGLKCVPEFRDFYTKMEGLERESEKYEDETLKEFLTIDLSWRPSNANIPKIPSNPILYMALEHEEDTKPEYIVENTYVGAQLDEVRKLGCVKSFIKVLFVRPRYKGEGGRAKRYTEHEETIKTETEKELKRQYIEAHERWVLISVTLDDINNPSEILFHGYKYNQDKEKLERFDKDKYSIKIDNSSYHCKIFNANL